MADGPTVNLVSGRLVAYNEDTCEIYQEGSWQHLQRTTATREYQSSGTTEEAVLLIGGYTDDSSDHSEHTTKWIPVDGAAAGHLKWFPTPYLAETKMFQQKNNPKVVCNMYS